MAQKTNNPSTFEDFELLASVSQLLMEVDLNRVMVEVIRLAAQAVGASKTSLFLHEANRIDWEHLITMRELSQDESIKVVSKVLDDGFAGWVFRNKQGAIIKDTMEDERWVIFPDDPSNQRSALCVPFLYRDEVIAVMTLVHEKPNHFQPHHLRLLTIITNQAAIALHNAQLFNTLNTQRRQLSAIFTAMNNALLALDEAGHILEANEAALQVLDAARLEEILGQYIGEFVMVDDAFKPIVEAVTAPDREQNYWEFDTRSERRKIDYKVSISIWHDDLRGSAGFVIVMHDMTKIYDLSRFRDEMLRVASHDLRSPIALIAGYADMASIDTPDAESPVHEYMDIIKNTTERMGTLVDDLLRVERVRSNPIELIEQINPAALVKVVIVNSRPLAKAKQIDFHTDIQLSDSPKILADPVLLRQAMQNLINNAIKYTQEGSVTLTSYCDEQRFHFVVEDTGIGIPEDDMPYIFESFYRVNSARFAEKGSGLGLSLVKSVIARHNGEIWVKSKLGEGSRFGFWLPLNQGKR